MKQMLNCKCVAILVTDGFEEIEMTEPKLALDESGAVTVIVSPTHGGTVKAWQHDHWGDDFAVDQMITNADAAEYDALLLPGGVMNPDALRIDSLSVQFVKRFMELGKPVAAICHGPWTLVEADAVRGRTLTSWPSLQTDIRNAGGNWVDREVVRDGNLVTSRKPDDLPAFIREMLALFDEARNGPRAERALAGSAA